MLATQALKHIILKKNFILSKFWVICFCQDHLWMTSMEECLGYSCKMSVSCRSPVRGPLAWLNIGEAEDGYRNGVEFELLGGSLSMGSEDFTGGGHGLI